MHRVLTPSTEFTGTDSDTIQNAPILLTLRPNQFEFPAKLVLIRTTIQNGLSNIEATRIPRDVCIGIFQICGFIAGVI